MTLIVKTTPYKQIPGSMKEKTEKAEKGKIMIDHMFERGRILE